jgi:hypothetical protein
MISWVEDNGEYRFMQRRIRGNDLFGFDWDDFIGKITDYSAFSGLRTTAMVFDQKYGRLTQAIGYTERLLDYAKKNRFNGESNDRKLAIASARDFLKGQLEKLVEENPRFAVCQKTGSKKRKRYKDDEQKPESYKAHGNYVHLVSKLQ